MSVIAPEHRVVLIRIPKTAPADGDPAALYTATREWWRVGAIRTEGGPAAPTHALAVVGGTVVAAYEILGWEQRLPDKRRAFDGVPAQDAVAQYVGADVRGYFPQGSQNPLRYVNCDPKAAQSPRVRELEELRSAPALSPEELAERAWRIARRLRTEPLTHLMLGHLELFHSNLLAWFVEHLPEQAEEVFGRELSRGTTAELRVDRERDHLDLAIRLPGRQVLAVENKVFAVYDLEQLDRNAKAVAGWADLDEPARLVLLSVLSPLEDPAWAGGTYTSPHGEWHYLSYDELGRRLEAALFGAGDSYEVETMRRYARLAIDLSELASLVTVTSTREPFDLPVDLEAALGDKRLAARLRKFRGRQVAQLLETALAEAGFGGGVSSGFAHGEPLLDWFDDVVGEDGALVSAGWQLQGGEFRRCLVLPHLTGTSPESQAARVAYAVRHPAFFDFSVTDALLGNSDAVIAPKAKAVQEQGYKKFNPDFIYRGKKVSGLTVQQLIDAALAVARSLR